MDNLDDFIEDLNVLLAKYNVLITTRASCALYLEYDRKIHPEIRLTYNRLSQTILKGDEE